MPVPKVFLHLTREEMIEIVGAFKALLDDPRVTSATLFFGPERFLPCMHTPHLKTHPFIAVGCDPIENTTYY
jgi:hypothetical protein